MCGLWFELGPEPQYAFPGTRGKGRVRDSAASCQGLTFPERFSESGELWLGGASPWQCPAAPCPCKYPLQAPSLLSSVLLPATQRGPLLSAGTSSPHAPGPECPLPSSPGSLHRFCSSSSVPSRTLLPACLTTVSLRCGHLLLGGFPFFIRFDNAFF